MLAHPQTHFSEGMVVVWTAPRNDDQRRYLDAVKEVKGHGPFTVAKVKEVTANWRRLYRHPQIVNLEGVDGEFSGAWFVPVL